MSIDHDPGRVSKLDPTGSEPRGPNVELSNPLFIRLLNTQTDLNCGLNPNYVGKMGCIDSVINYVIDMYQLCGQKTNYVATNYVVYQARGLSHSPK